MALTRPDRTRGLKRPVCNSVPTHGHWHIISRQFHSTVTFKCLHTGHWHIISRQFHSTVTFKCLHTGHWHIISRQFHSTVTFKTLKTQQVDTRKHFRVPGVFLPLSYSASLGGYPVAATSAVSVFAAVCNVGLLVRQREALFGHV